MVVWVAAGLAFGGDTSNTASLFGNRELRIGAVGIEEERKRGREEERKRGREEEIG